MHILGIETSCDETSAAIVHNGVRIHSNVVISSLKELFRGTKQPPRDMSHYPEEYCEIFFAIERNVLVVSQCLDEIRDEEMIHLYSLIKRCPDGRSEGFLHDVLFQSRKSFLEKLYPVSQK